MFDWLSGLFGGVTPFLGLLLIAAAVYYVVQFWKSKNFIGVVILLILIPFLLSEWIPYVVQSADSGLGEIETTEYTSQGVTAFQNCISGRECSPDDAAELAQRRQAGASTTADTVFEDTRVPVGDAEDCWRDVVEHNETNKSRLTGGLAPPWGGNRPSDWLPKGYSFAVEVREPDFGANTVLIQGGMLNGPLVADGEGVDRWSRAMTETGNNVSLFNFNDVREGVVAGTGDWPDACLVEAAGGGQGVVSDIDPAATQSNAATPICVMARAVNQLPFYTWKSDGTPGTDSAAPEGTFLTGESIGSPPSMFCKTNNGGMILTSDLP